MKIAMLCLLLVLMGCRDKETEKIQLTINNTEERKAETGKAQEEKDAGNEDEVLPESALKTETGLIIDKRCVSFAHTKKVWNTNPDGSAKNTEITIGKDNYQIKIENNGIKKWIKVPFIVWADVSKGDYWGKGPQ